MELLSAINDLWLKQITLAEQHKAKVFGRAAKRAWDYFGREQDWLSDEDTDGERFPQVNYLRRAVLPKTAEYVKIYLPFLHAKVPHRLCSPYRPQIPPELLGLPPGSPVPPTQTARIDDARSWLLGWFLNFLPTRVYDLRSEARRAVIEALVKGRSCLWTEMTDGPTGMMPASHFDSVDNLVIDPDCDGGLRTASWIARRRRRVSWVVADEYGIKVDELRSAYSSRRGRAESMVIANLEVGDEQPDEHADVTDYWEVYSRCGTGHRFLGATDEMRDLAGKLDNVGDNVCLAVCQGMRYPLNLNPDAFVGQDADAELKSRLSWPIAFWARRKNPWPMTNLDFYPDLKGPWARSPLEPALPLQQFLNDAYGFLFERVKKTCRDIIVTSEALEQQLKDALSGAFDQEIVSVKGKPGIELKQLIEILQFPPVNRDVLSMVQLGEMAFERATGMTDLKYGSGGQRQIRSSAEAQIREQNSNIRPDDMAECVEDFQSSVAEAEAGATRLHVPGTVIAPLYGENATDLAGNPISGQMTQLWDQVVTTSDPILAFSELNYSVEAGSGRRKNKATQIQNANDAAQYLVPMFMQGWMRTGNPAQLNAWMRMWCEAQDIDPAPFLFTLLPPPPPQMGPPGGPQGGKPSGPQQAPGGQGQPQGQPSGPPGGGSPQIPPEIAAMLQNLPPELLQQIFGGGGQGPPPAQMQAPPPQMAQLLQSIPPELLQAVMAGAGGGPMPPMG